MALRYDYAVFDGDRYLHNAMLTRAEARKLAGDGFRCVDVERAAKMGWDYPRFRGRRSVRPDAFRRGWRRD